MENFHLLKRFISRYTIFLILHLLNIVNKNLKNVYSRDLEMLPERLTEGKMCPIYEEDTSKFFCRKN